MEKFKLSLLKKSLYISIFPTITGIMTFLLIYSILTLLFLKKYRKKITIIISLPVIMVTLIFSIFSINSLENILGSLAYTKNILKKVNL